MKREKVGPAVPSGPRPDRRRSLLLSALCVITSLAGQLVEFENASESASGRASFPASRERTDNLLQPETVERITAPDPSLPSFPLLPSLPSPPERELTWTLLTENPEQAANTALALPPSDARTEWLRIIANDWTLANPTAALHWANQNLNSEDHHKFLATATAALAKTSPHQAATLISQLPADDLQSQTALTILSTWFDSDPTQAIAWAAQFPEPLRPRALQTLQSRANPQQFAEGFPDGAAEN